MESRGFCRWARPQHAFLSGPCRTVERRQYRAGAYDALLGRMKNGRTLGQSGRLTQLEPVIRRSFDIASMARLAVGPSYAYLGRGAMPVVTESFWALHLGDRFDSYAGQKLEVTGE